MGESKQGLCAPLLGAHHLSEMQPPAVPCWFCTKSDRAAGVCLQPEYVSRSFLGQSNEIEGAGAHIWAVSYDLRCKRCAEQTDPRDPLTACKQKYKNPQI